MGINDPFKRESKSFSLCHFVDKWRNPYPIKEGELNIVRDIFVNKLVHRR